MDKHTQSAGNDVNTIIQDANDLIAATADVSGAKVCEARQRLSAALERGREIAARVRDKAVEGAKVADKAVHEHPYQAIGIAVGIGAIIGYLITRRCRCKSD
jgi:ElaB/YqjD/DUF883 family membrane-anchored ribosome-binding protein